VVRVQAAAVAAETTEVVVADADGAIVGDVDRRGERLAVGFPVHLSGRRPRPPAVGRDGQYDAIALPAAEPAVLPDYVRASAAIHSDVRNIQTSAYLVAGFRVGHPNIPLLVHDRRGGPRACLVAGTDDGHLCCGVIAIRVPGDGEHVEQLAVGQHGDLVGDRLRAGPGVVDDPGRLPALPPVGGPSHPRRPTVYLFFLFVVLAGGDRPVPDGVHKVRITWVRGDRLLV